jgi:D-sedoheptulose 7-phosphate isomerase
MKKLGGYLTALSNIDSNVHSTLEYSIKSYPKTIILGNGGSNAIATHMAQDYTKVLGKRAISFSDPIKLSCYANDYGWDNAYQKFLMENWDEKTFTILISSSGESKNILNCQEFLIAKNCNYGVLTGFNSNNTLHSAAGKKAIKININSDDYGIIECVHEIILHSIL